MVNSSPFAQRSVFGAHQRTWASDVRGCQLTNSKEPATCWLRAVGKRSHVVDMTLDLTDLEAALLLKELNGQGDPCQDQTRAGARASTTAAEALRPAADDYGAEAHRALNLRRTPPSIRAERHWRMGLKLPSSARGVSQAFLRRSVVVRRRLVRFSARPSRPKSIGWIAGTSLQCNGWQDHTNVGICCRDTDPTWLRHDNKLRRVEASHSGNSGPVSSCLGR